MKFHKSIHMVRIACKAIIKEFPYAQIKHKSVKKFTLYHKNHLNK